MAQDVVRSRHVKEELRHAEIHEQRLTCERARVAVLEGEDDFTARRLIDGLARQAGNEINRAGDVEFQPGNSGGAIWKHMRAAVRQQRTGNDCVAIGFAHLLREIIHGGREPHLQQNVRIDLTGLGVTRCMIEQPGEIAEEWHENVHG